MKAISGGEHSYISVSFLICFAYISYLAGEMLGISGIMSLLFCGILMQHYHWYSLNEEARIAAKGLFKVLAFIAETIVFLYLGVNVFSSIAPLRWDYKLIIATTVLCFMGRALNIFPLSAVANIWRKKKISARQQVFMFYSGAHAHVCVCMRALMLCRIAWCDRVHSCNQLSWSKRAVHRWRNDVHGPVHHAAARQWNVLDCEEAWLDCESRCAR